MVADNIIDIYRLDIYRTRLVNEECEISVERKFRTVDCSRNEELHDTCIADIELVVDDTKEELVTYHLLVDRSEEVLWIGEIPVVCSLDYSHCKVFRLLVECHEPLRSSDLCIDDIAVRDVEDTCLCLVARVNFKHLTATAESISLSSLVIEEVLGCDTVEIVLRESDSEI